VSKKEYEIDEKLQYRDHLTDIIKQAEADGQFDDLPGKGKPLNLGQPATNPYEAQLHKTMKDNHILPRWIELGQDIDQLKEKMKTMDNRKEKRKLLKTINKKIKEYNYMCPPSLQRMRIEG